jgi:hypothetical protein
MGKELRFNANNSVLSGLKSIPNTAFCHPKQNQNFMRGIPPANHRSESHVDSTFALARWELKKRKWKIQTGQYEV